MRFGMGLVFLGVLMGLGGRVAVDSPGQAAIKQASNYVEWGRLKEARDLLSKALNDPANSNDAPMLAYFSHLESLFGNNQAATDFAKRAVAMDDNCASCHLFMFEAMAQHAKTVSQMRALLILPKMKKELEKATSLDPNLGDTQWAWLELDLGLPAAVGGSAADAMSHADRLAQIDPVDGHLARAHVDNAEGKSDAALAEYRAAAQEHPEDPRGVFDLGRTLYNDGKYSEAAPYLARAFDLNHESALYSAYDAANLVHLKQLPAARAVLEAGRKQHPLSRLGDYLAAQALKTTNQDFDWAKQLLASYTAVPTEPGQPTAADAAKLLSSLG
ncbi:MAG TPA: tetratricopeptide repeat protein [Terriglobales bacterium]|nr:tetratricopeptide repeat protein [Terriglobales bacterium]